MKSKNERREELIKYAASRGIRLTFSDDPTEYSLPPERLEEINELLSLITPEQIEECFKDND